MNWLINGKTVKSLMKDGKEIVKVERVEDGKILYEKESSNNYVVATVTGDSISFGSSNLQWLESVGDVIINWGDGTSDTVNNPRNILSHTYTDNKPEHTIKFKGEVISFRNLCFEYRNNLTSIWIPHTVTSLGYQCFKWCSSLTHVTLSDGVTNIDTQCFYKCTSLIDYELYWTGNNIINYDSGKMPNNTNSIFTIPAGETTNYIAKGYPSNKLVERS